MPVIDVDSHFYEPLNWLDDFPELRSVIPPADPLDLILGTAFGEVLASLPPQHRPSPYRLFTKAPLDAQGRLPAEVHAALSEKVVGSVTSMPGGYDPDARVRMLDEVGIDLQFVLPTFAFNPVAWIRRERPELTVDILQAYNTWATDQLSGHLNRLVPVTVIDLRAMSQAVVEAELKRVRAGGSRCFLFWATPAKGMSLAHPEFDWFWATCVDLGLLPMVHVGAGKPNLDLDWLANDRAYPLSHLTYFSQLHQIPEVLLSELLAGGVFERFPALRLIVAELGIDWVPSFMRRMDRLAKSGKHHGSPWPYDRLPSEVMRTNVRVSPLPGDPTVEVLDELGGDILVWSSDYPHPEGGSNNLARARTSLTDTSPQLVARYLGDTLASDLAVGA